MTAQPGQLAGHVVVAGTHERHLEIILDRLKREFRVEANVGRPEVAYRESITRAANGEMKYARQAVGRGHYAHVKLRMHPGDRDSGCVFESHVTGGAIPAKYMKAIEEGIQDALGRGVIAGFPVHDVRIDVHDGSFHEADSNDEAFRIAASLAVLDAARKAEPVLLEPVMRVSVVVPPECAEDVVKNMLGRRGHVQLQSGRDEGEVIEARVPLAELFGYESDLRARTRGRGTYRMLFEEYVPVRPPDDADDRDSRVSAPRKPAPKLRESAVEVPEPEGDRDDSDSH